MIPKWLVAYSSSVFSWEHFWKGVRKRILNAISELFPFWSRHWGCDKMKRWRLEVMRRGKLLPHESIKYYCEWTSERNLIPFCLPSAVWELHVSSGEGIIKTASWKQGTVNWSPIFTSPAFGTAREKFMTFISQQL